MITRALTLVLLGTTALVSLDGCARRSSHHSPEVVVASTDKHVGHGPPPHAPAHGYRHKMRGDVELSYDAELGVYVVLGSSHVYYHGDKQLYYRLKGSRWLVSVSLSNGWQPITDANLPGHLASAGKRHAKGKHKKHEVAESDP